MLHGSLEDRIYSDIPQIYRCSYAHSNIHVNEHHTDHIADSFRDVLVCQDKISSLLMLRELLRLAALIRCVPLRVDVKSSQILNSTLNKRTS